jgi:hypothetical protein
MAETTRTRIIANPGRRRRRRNHKMTAKQIKYFGTKAQKAALRHNRARKRVRHNRARRRYAPKPNPARRRLHARRSRANRRRHPPVSNPGQIIGFTVGNPAKRRKKGKRNPMAAHRRRRRRMTAKQAKYFAPRRHRRRRSQSNPGRRRRHHSYGHRRRRHIRRNPGGGGFASSIGSLVTNAVFVIVGALGSKLGAQIALGSNNVGLIGYGANAAVGGLLWFLADRVMRNRAAASGLLAGTVVQIVLRAINDFTPFGQYVSQLGMGDYQMQAYVTPQVLTDPWNSANIAIPAGWAPQIAPPAKAGVAGLGAYGGSLYGGSGGLY